MTPQVPRLSIQVNRKFTCTHKPAQRTRDFFTLAALAGHLKKEHGMSHNEALAVIHTLLQLEIGQQPIMEVEQVR